MSVEYSDEIKVEQAERLAELEAWWTSAPVEVRIWAVDQARQMFNMVAPLPLGLDQVMIVAKELAWEVRRQPVLKAPNIEDSGSDGNIFASPTWKRDRGL